MAFAQRKCDCERPFLLFLQSIDCHFQATRNPAADGFNSTIDVRRREKEAEKQQASISWELFTEKSRGGCQCASAQPQQTRLFHLPPPSWESIRNESLSRVIRRDHTRMHASLSSAAVTALRALPSLCLDVPSLVHVRWPCAVIPARLGLTAFLHGLITFHLCFPPRLVVVSYPPGRINQKGQQRTTCRHSFLFCSVSSSTSSTTTNDPRRPFWTMGPTRR